MAISDRSRLDALAAEVAQRSLGYVRGRFGGDTLSMSSPELRGYVRARADAIIRFHTHEMLREHGVSTLHAEALSERALERTVYFIERELELQTHRLASNFHAAVRAAA
jgi:hypothetical protein